MNLAAQIVNFILILTICASNVDAKLFECTDGYVRCADNTKCIPEEQLCDYNQDCEDLSDERFKLCQLIHKKRVGSCANVGKFYTRTEYDSNCYHITTICKINSPVTDESYQPLCQEITGGLKPSEEYATLRREKANVEQFFNRLATSFNESTRIENGSNCPPLYVDIGSKCVAIFLAAKVTWAEAKHFCESISGTLAIIRKMKDFEALLKHFKIYDLGTNFWIGGVHNTKLDNSSSWMWLDKKDIVMGAPYWSVYYTTNCTLRENSDHCYVYDIFPREHTEGYCLSMDYEFHYYFTNSNCLEKRNPLCFLDEK